MKPVKAVGIQYAALPWRQTGRSVEILLVTSRESHRWVIPKGWPMKGRAPHESAAVEALEEAGISGEIDPTAIGSYRYLKRVKGDEALPIQVIVFALQVHSQLDHWKEKDQRQSRWFPYPKAAAVVAEPALKRLIRDFGQARSSGPMASAARFGRWMDAAFFGLRRD
ncbi:MAG: NUDIX hydrolase [Caulobacteraceae bacterium]